MECPHCLKVHLKKSYDTKSEDQNFLEKKTSTVKSGFYFRDSDNKLIQRFRCLDCRKSFSSETTHICRYQKKRFLNSTVYTYLCSGISQRRLAIVLNVNLKTIARKFHLIGEFCLTNLNLQNHIHKKYKLDTFIFDDMETFEHTKCKPLSITLAVDEKTRFILGFKVAKMAAKGRLAHIALKKYGKRKDERRLKRDMLLKEIKNKFKDFKGTIKSDENPHYVAEVKKYFKENQYIRFKGGRGAIVGQGELKKLGFDPLFSLNHTAAMLRANINRLFRRTWNTTKKIKGLEYHIAMYVWYHNFKLIS